MIQAVAVGILSAVLAITMPAALLTSADEPERSIVLVVEKPVQKSETEIRLDTGQGIIGLPLEEYLEGVVAAEMPVSFEMEALKAQTVAARTFALRRVSERKHEEFDLCADYSCCQAWYSDEVLARKLGELWEPYKEKIENAVQGTASEVLVYEGELIEAVYFSCSGGSTEAAVEVWGNDVPYLQAVDSTGEEIAAKYKSESVYSTAEFIERIEAENKNITLSGSPTSWFGDVSYTSGGGVDKMIIGGQWFSGTQLRRIFELNSTKFNVSVEEAGIAFEVFGYGHRVGMSQYGANVMAKAGDDYREILEHYYTGASIVTR